MDEYNVNKSVTQGTTAEVVSLEKDNQTVFRKSITIINTSSAGQVISIAIDSEAVAGAGIVLNAGGSWSDTSESGYVPTQKYIAAISNAAGGTLAIQERVGVR